MSELSIFLLPRNFCFSAAIDYFSTAYFFFVDKGYRRGQGRIHGRGGGYSRMAVFFVSSAFFQGVPITTLGL